MARNSDSLFLDIAYIIKTEKIDNLDQSIKDIH